MINLEISILSEGYNYLIIGYQIIKTNVFDKFVWWGTHRHKTLVLGYANKKGWEPLLYSTSSRNVHTK